MMMLPLFSYRVIVELGLAFVLVIVLVQFLRRRDGLPLPPGPPSEFLLGHARVMPRENVAETYAKWGKEYSTSTALALQVFQHITNNRGHRLRHYPCPVVSQVNHNSQ